MNLSVLHVNQFHFELIPSKNIRKRLHIKHLGYGHIRAAADVGVTFV